MSLVLAFDTATAATVVGLRDATGVVRGRRDDPAAGERPSHASTLLALADELLVEAGAQWGDVTRIGVGVGPGTFTGLRIGVASARGLAQASGAPLVPVSTLEALAHAARAAGAHGAEQVLAVIDARRGEAFAAVWDAAGEQLAQPVAVAPEALAGLVPNGSGTIVAVGDGAVRFRAPLEAAGLLVPGDADPLHRVDPAALCALAAAGAVVAAENLVPDYLRLPDAELARRLADHQ
ncbi:unannotated protein [freshwater metagenome]|uniref:Unannotated protein n=1 Tax=freshwater metagenome TaxID=449393 RepID=A0A6J7IG04_9ZZZZ